MPSMEDLAALGRRPRRGAGGERGRGLGRAQRFFPRGTPLSVLLDQSKATAKRYGTEKYPESYLTARTAR
jgi:hypothetical protein